MANTISIKINDPSKPAVLIENIPWFPGVTVLQAMIIGQEMFEKQFSFRAVYASFFGAFIDMIDGTEDKDSNFWLFSINNKQSPVGVSEAILLEDQEDQNVEIEWNYGMPESGHPAVAQADLKRRALKYT
jgi:hypothetical protein